MPPVADGYEDVLLLLLLQLPTLLLLLLLYDNARKVRRMCLTNGLDLVWLPVVVHTNCRNTGAQVSADKRRTKALG